MKEFLSQIKFTEDGDKELSTNTTHFRLLSICHLVRPGCENEGGSLDVRSSYDLVDDHTHCYPLLSCQYRGNFTIIIVSIGLLCLVWETACLLYKKGSLSIASPLLKESLYFLPVETQSCSSSRNLCLYVLQSFKFPQIFDHADFQNLDSSAVSVFCFSYTIRHPVNRRRHPNRWYQHGRGRTSQW